VVFNIYPCRFCRVNQLLHAPLTPPLLAYPAERNTVIVAEEELNAKVGRKMGRGLLYHFIWGSCSPGLNLAAVNHYVGDCKSFSNKNLHYCALIV